MNVIRLGIGVGIAAIVAVGSSACGGDHADHTARTAHTPNQRRAVPATSESGATAAAAMSASTTTLAGTESLDGGGAKEIEVSMDWGTPGAGKGPLFAIADGMCVNAQVFPIEGGGAIFTYGNGEYINWETQNPTMITTAYVGEEGITPDRGRGFGAALDAEGATLGAIGGSYPDRLHAVLDFSSRAGFARQLRVGSAKPTGWKTLLGSTPRDPINATGTLVAVSSPIPWSDGAYLFATDTSSINTGNGTPNDTYAFRVLLPDGTLASKPKVPGPDLGEAAFRLNEPRSIARLSNGEVVGIGFSEKKKLVRWSPTKPVDDLPFPVTPKANVVFRGGKNRAVFALDDALYIYSAGASALVPAKVNAKLAKGFQWTVGPDDEIVVIQPSGAVIEESATSALREADKLPFAATFEGVPTGVAWGIAKGKGDRGSDALVHKGAGGRWEVVALPTPPFGSDARAPLKISSVSARDPNDVFFIAQRSEAGYGWKHPPSFRAIYRTKRPREVVRCQDAPHAWTGAGVHRWPPAADDACKNPVVVASFGDSTAKGYPNVIASSLRGKTQFGETLSFITFEGRGTTNLGIMMTDVPKAKSLATHLSLLGLRPEVSCGKPTPVRSFTLDVAKGTFSK